MEKEMATQSSILAWEIPWTEEPGGLLYSPWDHKELGMTWQLNNNKEAWKEMATQSSILAWRSPWTEKPGRLQSMGWQRVGHN